MRNEPSRRQVLQQGLAAALATALRGARAEAAPGYDGIHLTVGDELFFEQLLNDPMELAKFRQNPKIEEIGKLIRVLAKTEDEWTKPIEHNANALHAGARELYNEKNIFIGNGTVLRIHDDRAQGGSPVYRYVLVTAAHVAKDAVLPEGARLREWAFHPKGGDVAVCELDENAVAFRKNKRDALHLGISPKRAARDISGLFGLSIGRDNDFGALERKVYPSRISPRITDKLFQVAGVDSSGAYQKDDLRLVVLHPNQIQQIQGLYAAQGMSGCAFVFFDEGQQGVEFGGIFVAVTAIDIPETDEKGKSQKRRYVIGDIVDHVTVREAIQDLFNHN